MHIPARTAALDDQPASAIGGQSPGKLMFCAGCTAQPADASTTASRSRHLPGHCDTLHEDDAAGSIACAVNRQDRTVLRRKIDRMSTASRNASGSASKRCYGLASDTSVDISARYARHNRALFFPGRACRRLPLATLRLLLKIAPAYIRGLRFFPRQTRSHPDQKETES